MGTKRRGYKPRLQDQGTLTLCRRALVFGLQARLLSAPFSFGLVFL